MSKKIDQYFIYKSDIIKMGNTISCNGAEYEVCGGGCCKLSRLKGNHNHFKVPSIISRNCKRYQVIEISPFPSHEYCVAEIISFDESSAITCLPTSFIGRSKSLFIFPPKVMHVSGSLPLYFPKIKAGESSKRYVSIVRDSVIINHFPLGIAYQHLLSHHFLNSRDNSNCWRLFIHSKHKNRIGCFSTISGVYR